MVAFRVLMVVSALVCVPLSYGANLTEIEDFGTNPGKLKMYVYVPKDLPDKAPLVVSLHGCTMTAENYSYAGWKELADKWKFYVLFPEQNRGDHLQCWRWFLSGDTARGQGELKSIVEMIDKMKADYSIDDKRIFVEGQSAGGWMVPILLAAYPDVFAGGATNAGGPAYCASCQEPLVCMQARTCMNTFEQSPDAWGNLVRRKGYGEHTGTWPVISIWHGTADGKVEHCNQQELVDQWTNVHQIDQNPDKVEKIGPQNKVEHKEYRDLEGKTLVETYSVAGMDHGTPIAVDEGCGKAGPWILDEGICAVRYIGRFWGLEPSANR